MSDSTADIPSGDTLRDADSISGDAFNQLSARLAELESKIGDKELGWEDEYRKKLLAEVEQRIKVRWSVVVMAGCVLVIMFMFALVGFHAVTATDSPAQSFGALKVGLFIAPVASITAVLVVLLLGAFKRHTDENDKVDLPALATEIAKAFQQA